MSKNNNIIEITNLTKKFNQTTAVNDISFSVKKGEIFGFLGPNGAGKTTTINIICTLLSPTSGSVNLCGYDTVKERNKVRNYIGLVFQDPSLDDRLTALENLNLHALLYSVPRKLIKSRCEEVLDMVGLSNRKNDLVRFYSSGMKRRLEIARGLIHYPKILFLDEPTIGLDPQTRNKIWDYVVKLKKSQNITIFLTTHYMEETEICDRIAIIDKGKIIALDTPENLKKSVSGEIITITSEENIKLKLYIEEKFKKKIEMTKNNEIKFEVKDSSNFIPDFIRTCPVAILSINARKPTLDDVFLNLTGREIREEFINEKDVFKVGMRNRMKKR